MAGDGPGVIGAEEVRKLNPRPGDVLVFSGLDEGAQEMLVDTLHGEPRLEGTLIVFLGPGQSVEHLDAEEMRANGWVRAIPRR